MFEGTSPIDDIHAALPEVPMIFGGYFASIDYHVLLEKYPFAAAVVRGNGELAALEISRSLSEGRSFLSDRTPNLAWAENGEIHTTPIQPTPPDDFPILDFRLLHNPCCYQKIDLLTSRGCPFDCDYCLERLMRPYGAHSLDWVARQLEHIETVLPNRRIFVFDPIFGVGRERTLEICKILTGRRFSWGFLGRVDVLAADLLPALHTAGVQTVFLGIEAVSASALLRMNKVRSTAMAERYVKSALDVIKACFENDVTPFIGLMLGFPGDSESDYQSVLSFLETVQELHDRSAAQPGLYIHPMITKIYDNSPLADRAEQEFPDATLRAGPLVGETFVTSPELDLDTIHSYTARIAQTRFASRTFQPDPKEVRAGLAGPPTPGAPAARPRRACPDPGSRAFPSRRRAAAGDSRPPDEWG
jgi:radical SAM superfamily enzyme YgiQ (UPF0313 family)